MANALVIPCFIRTQWDLRCLIRLLDSVVEQSLPFSAVVVVDDASPLPSPGMRTWASLAAQRWSVGPGSWPQSSRFGTAEPESSSWPAVTGWPATCSRTRSSSASASGRVQPCVPPTGSQTGIARRTT